MHCESGSMLYSAAFSFITPTMQDCGLHQHECSVITLSCSLYNGAHADKVSISVDDKVSISVDDTVSISVDYIEHFIHCEIVL